jgi:hypothetical protein
MGDQVQASIPAGPHSVFTEEAAEQWIGKIVHVEDDECGKREVGRIIGSRLVDNGRAIQVEMEIGDEILCEHLRA